MEQYLNKGIKEVIAQFPAVGDILNEYSIGCVTCEAGTCLLKDIVGVHNLAPEEEAVLMARIRGVIYPDQQGAVNPVREKAVPKHKEITYSPPMKRLVNEHVLIKKLLALIPVLIETLDLASEDGRQAVLDSVDFIRSYADKYHHAKEEQILFKYFDENLDIIKAMHLEHEKGRGYVRGILAAVPAGDQRAVAEYLNNYRQLLTEHIKKEDEILYPWMDRNLSVTQVGEMFCRFNNVEDAFGDTRRRYEKLINELTDKLKKEEVRQ